MSHETNCTDLAAGQRVVFERGQLQSLLEVLANRGYRIVGPAVRDGAVVYDEIRSIDNLPKGWTDVQDGGTYRLKKRDDEALFGYAVGPHSWKKFLHPPAVRLWKMRRHENGFEIELENEEPPKTAFLGVRSCELHAIAIQDKVFVHGPHVDSLYQARRERTFVVAVQCGHAGGTCFCVSMNTGPQATFGFDLALTEVLVEGRHYFVAEIGSDGGAEVMKEVPCRAANEAEQAAAGRVVAETAQHMGRQVETAGIKDLLYRNYEHARWDDVVSRCLTCGNCTLVCPTCFCTQVEDVTDIAGEHAERWQKWDSCFTFGFSYVHGGSVRPSTRSRYRQWMTHKLATWIDQFGTSGCVGCGRCITWCPVGIDITQEVRAIRETEPASAAPEEEDRHGNS